MLNSIEEKVSFLGRTLDTTRVCTKEERTILENVKGGLNRKFNIYGWALTGGLALKKNCANYNDIVRKYEKFRQLYIYQNTETPVCVVLKHKDTPFSIVDIRTQSDKNQIKTVLNVASAMSREYYNPEQDLPLGIKVFVTGDESLIVLMRVYSPLSLPIGPYDLRRLIFSNMKVDSSSGFMLDEEKIEKANEEVLRKNLTYWRGKMNSLSSPVKVPFAIERTGEIRHYTVNFDLEESLFDKISKYVSQTETSLSVFLLHEYGVMFGEYSETKMPMLAVRRNDTQMKVFPLFIDLKMTPKESYEDILVQAANFRQHSECYFEEFIAGTQINPDKYFDVAFDFVNQNEETSLSDIAKNGANRFNPSLEVIVRYSADKISIQYTYDAGCIGESAVRTIHDSFIGILKHRISEEVKFNWKDYISECKSQEEKNRKLEIAQKALYIKNADFFYSDNPEEVIKLSENGYVGNYIVEDTIYHAEKPSTDLGILVSGHIEERYTDMEGMVKTVSVYKPGFIFGIESVTKKCSSPFSYIAVDDVKILWIPGDTFNEVTATHPECYMKLLEKTIGDAVRIKKLWVME